MKTIDNVARPTATTIAEIPRVRMIETRKITGKSCNGTLEWNLSHILLRMRRSGPGTDKENGPQGCVQSGASSGRSALLFMLPGAQHVRAIEHPKRAQKFSFLLRMSKRPLAAAASLLGFRAISCFVHFGLDVAHEVAEFVDRHSADGLPEPPHPARHLIWVNCWVFRHT